MERKCWIVGSVVILVLRHVLECSAANYLVGDSSGWDISSDLASWPIGKTFLVGDSLVFQYSSSHSLNEVTQDNFNTCNTSNILKAYTNGNITVSLSKPGDRFFVCGNRLHCLGGMKLQVKVGSNQDYAPAAAPVPGAANPPSTTRQQPSLKNNNNDDIIPSSSGFILTSGMNAYFLLFSSLFIWSYEIPFMY